MGEKLYLNAQTREFQGLSLETQSLIRIIAGEEYVFAADEHIHFLGMNLRKSSQLVEIAHSLKKSESQLITWQEGLEFALECLSEFHPESYRHSIRVKELMLITRDLWQKYCLHDLPMNPLLKKVFDRLKMAYPDCPGKFLGINFSDQEWASILYAALFHDLGKMGFPAWFWNKPGKFSPEEAQYREHHPRLFYPLGEMFGVPYIVTALALFHHFLNLGYPRNGLIRMFGDYMQDFRFKCILCLLTTNDIYDGMRGERSYRRDVYDHQQVITRMPKELGEIGLRFVPFLDAAFELGVLKSLYSN